MNEIPHGGIASLDELYDSEVVRSEFLSPTFQAKVTIQYASLSFRTCIHKRISSVWKCEILMTASAEAVVIS
jgi:hypothetical protein